MDSCRCRAHKAACAVSVRSGARTEMCVADGCREAHEGGNNQQAVWWSPAAPYAPPIPFVSRNVI